MARPKGEFLLPILLNTRDHLVARRFKCSSGDTMNIRNALIGAGSAIAMASLATGALAAGSVSTTAPASVTVLSPVTITKTANMVFGNVVRPTTGVSTITLSANDVVTETGGGDGTVAPSATSSAQFDVAAPSGTTFTTSQGLTFVQTGLTNIVAATPVASGGTLGTIAASGIQTLHYGGSFDMNASTPVQAYTGTLTVTVNYN